MRVILLVLTVSMLMMDCNALYTEPPLANITTWNNGRAVLLNSFFDSNFSKSSVVVTPWYEISVNGSMAIAGITPLVDNTTTYGSMTRTIVERGHQMGWLTGTDGAICDKSRENTTACDLDGDGCGEVEKESYSFSIIGLTFKFRNVSEYIEPEFAMEGVLGQQYKHSVSNMVLLPSNVSKEMESASGSETLSIAMNGSMTFVYVIDDRKQSDIGCTTDYKIFEKTIIFQDNLSVYAGGKYHLFFVETPPVNEQWFRNNKISVLVLSQRKIYHAVLIKDGDEVFDAQLRVFNITENRVGIKEIYSNPENDSAFLGVVNVTPIPLEQENNSFSYLYRFSYGYPGELGRTNFELRIADVFLSNDSNEQTVFSRQLSYGNTTETGSPAEWETTRGSVTFEKQSPVLLELLFGMLGIVIVVMLLRFKVG
ncbi:MAG: hypothetical protein QW590_03800 [Candidatus Bilamarchaeaceae archaeon]